MSFDVLIIGGGAAGLSCALMLGSAKEKPFVAGKKIGIVMHQKASALSSAVLNNVLGVQPGTTGKEILENGKKHLAEQYPDIVQIEKEKVIKIEGEKGDFTVTTNKNTYRAGIVVVAIGAGNPVSIEGLEEFAEPHAVIPAVKNKIQLKNNDHEIKPGLYVAGILAGWISQVPVAAASGTQVAGYILRDWNNGQTVMIHDAIG